MRKLPPAVSLTSAVFVHLQRLTVFDLQEHEQASQQLHILMTAHTQTDTNYPAGKEIIVSNNMLLQCLHR